MELVRERVKTLFAGSRDLPCPSDCSRARELSLEENPLPIVVEVVHRRKNQLPWLFEEDEAEDEVSLRREDKKTKRRKKPARRLEILLTPESDSSDLRREKDGRDRQGER